MILFIKPANDAGYFYIKKQGVSPVFKSIGKLSSSCHRNRYYRSSRKRLLREL